MSLCVLDGGTHILLKLNVKGCHLLHQLLQGRSITIILHRLCRCRCRLLELLLLSEWGSLVFTGGGLVLLLSKWLLLLCLLLLWTRTIPQVRMISPTRIISVGVRIILLLLRSKWLSKLHGINISNMFYLLESGTCICWMIKCTTNTT